MEEQYGIICEPTLAPLAAAFQSSLLSSAGLRIAGGTDEILKNIIAERVLGLPGDSRVDKDVAFNELPARRGCCNGRSNPLTFVSSRASRRCAPPHPLCRASAR